MAKSMWKHIANRFMIHVFSSSLVWLIAYLALVRPLLSWNPTYASYIFAAITGFAVIAPREAWDVARGGSLTKSVFDFISWILGFTLTVFLFRSAANVF